MQLMPERPPYVRFETRAVARQKLATEGGALYYVDVDFILITPAGSKDVIEKVVTEYFPYLQEMVRQKMFDPRWLEAYQAAFRAWKHDQPLPVNGTPVKNWPVATPAEVKNLTNCGVLAVEDLAQANEELLARIGMGARSLKQRAVDWVQSNASQAPLVEQLEAQRSIIAGMQARLDEVVAENQRLGGALQERNNQLALHAQQGTAPPQNTYVATSAERERSASAQESKLIDATLEEELS